jgi:hypothetical protein
MHSSGVVADHNPAVLENCGSLPYRRPAHQVDRSVPKLALQFQTKRFFLTGSAQKNETCGKVAIQPPS